MGGVTVRTLRGPGTHRIRPSALRDPTFVVYRSHREADEIATAGRRQAAGARASWRHRSTHTLKGGKAMFSNIRFVGGTAIAAGIALAVSGIIQVTDTPSGETTVVGIEHVSLGAFTAALVLMIPAVLRLGALAARGRMATLAVGGQVALALLTITSNVSGEDLGIFPAVAAASNLAIFAGFVALAIALRRGGHLPQALAIGVPLSWIAALPMSSIGGTVLAGGFWIVLGYLIATESLEQLGRAVPRTAAT
jgi:hypothetical protein